MTGAASRGGRDACRAGRAAAGGPGVRGRGAWSRALRAAGLRRGPRSRPLFGWASLTPAEQAVASLVADRADQPADRRAAVHLAADRADPPGYVFAKLDIACRAQLAAQVTRHRL
jgi:hypothetical protein